MPNAKESEDSLSPEDRLLWDAIRKTVTPLKARIPPASTPKSPRCHLEKHPLPLPQAQGVLPHESVASAPPLPVRQKRLDDKMRRRLKRGVQKINARLDLHGLTKDEAYTALLSFLKTNYENNKRFVLVITGKGRKHHEQSGVLRHTVPSWLAILPFSEMVTGFSVALPQHGGEGALYVRLRKKRLSVRGI